MDSSAWWYCAGDAAQALGPAIMTVFIVFGGYYANASNVPKGLRWIAHTSLIKYAFEAFCVNEFKGLTFVNDKPGRVGSESGEEVSSRHSPAPQTPCSLKLLSLEAGEHAHAWSSVSQEHAAHTMHRLHSSTEAQTC